MFKKIISLAIVSMFTLFIGIAANAQLVSANFETDLSANFNVFGYGGATNANDYSANFVYDYSTWTPAVGQTGPSTIPKSPHSGATDGTKALRLEANHADAVLEAAGVSVIPKAASGLTDFIMSFDLWMSYNGGVLGGNGSTEYTVVGGHAAGTQVEWASGDPSSGFFWAFTADTGAAQDYRYYEGKNGAGVPDPQNAVPNWNGANELDALGAGWQALFPAPPYKAAGCPGHAWTYVEMMVQGNKVTVFFTPKDGVRTQVASWTIVNAAITSGYPFVGYMDIFIGMATDPVGDNFALIDNLVIRNISKVENWEKN